MYAACQHESVACARHKQVTRVPWAPACARAQRSAGADAQVAGARGEKCHIGDGVVGAVVARGAAAARAQGARAAGGERSTDRVGAGRGRRERQGWQAWMLPKVADRMRDPVERSCILYFLPQFGSKLDGHVRAVEH
eukprot:2300170-Prymnesium_polylepis.1